MKIAWVSYITTIILGSIFLSCVLWVFSPVNPSLAINSPIPLDLALFHNRQVTSLSLWLPTVFAKNISAAHPQFTAQSVLLYDLATEKTLYTKNESQRLPMASLTKIMTAIVALENKKANDRYLVPKEAMVGENSMGLTEGELLNLQELLYGLLLPSGNDAAETIAANYPGGRRAFIQAMNDKAKALGLRDTNFTNPSGLQGDGVQYTTAKDLLVMTRYALDTFPSFRTIVQTYEHEIAFSSTHKAFYLYNETNLITTYPGVKGVKTGYTPEAGLCLVTYLDYDGHEIIGVLLGSQNRRQEMKELLDFGLTSQGKKPPKHS